MLTQNYLKIIAMESVFNSDIEKEKKIKTMEFIKDSATPHQCMGVILDNKLYNLNEAGEKDIEQRFIEEDDKSHRIRKTIFAHAFGPTGIVANTLIKVPILSKWAGPKGVALAFAAGIAGLLQWGIYRGIRSTFDNCTKECGTLKINNPRRQLCLYKCKLSTLEKAINLTKTSLAKATNPEDKTKISAMLSKQQTAFESTRRKVLDYQSHVKNNK